MKSKVFQLGDVTFDPTTRTLSHIDGRSAQLRNKSKEVLGLLLETPNLTVSKTDIMNRVWSDVTVSDESLVQCIADIRKLIGAEAKRVVETVPREGYRINPTVQAEPPGRRAPIAMLATLALVFIVAGVVWQQNAPLVPPQPSAENAPATAPLGTDNTDAYLEVLKGRVSANIFSHNESLTAERHFRRAIAMDPNYARAYAELGTLLAVRFENDWTVLEQADRQKSLFYAEKAIALEPDLWLGHYALGRLHSVFSNLDTAETHLTKAMSLQPDNEDARAYLGIVKTFRGDAEGAIAILESVVRSHPNPPYWYHFGLGHALFNAGRLDAAERALSDCIQLAENSPYCLRYLIGVHGAAGQHAKAQTAIQAYASMGFDPSVGGILKLITFHHPGDRAQLEQALRDAGLPE